MQEHSDIVFSLQLLDGSWRKKKNRSAARTIKACSTLRWMHGRTDTWVNMACYGILLKPGRSSHRCIQHRLWHFRSATSSCPQCASLRWLEQPQPWMVAIHRWQQQSPQLVEKPTLHEPSDPVSWWKCQLLLRCVEGRVPRTSMLNLPFCCRHVEPSNERVQDKCQTSHHIKWFKNHLKCCYCATMQTYIGKLC